MNNDDTLIQSIEDLRGSYRADLRERLGWINGLWEKAVKGPGRAEYIESLRSSVQTLAEYSESCGLAAVVDVAHLLGMSLDELVTSPSLYSDERRVNIDLMLDYLRRTLDGAAGTAGAETGPVTDRRLVYIIGSGSTEAVDIAQQLGFFGYRAVVVGSMAMALKYMGMALPGAVLVDACHMTGRPGGDAGELTELARRSGCPLVFISDEGEMPVRLSAVRAGAGAFFTRPVGIDELVDLLDVITVEKEVNPYHVLVIEDDLEQAVTISLVLQNAGMLVSFITNPFKVMKPLVEFQPELILMDLKLPGCSGVELASIIRQQQAFVSIPIVFYSEERDMDRRLYAMSSGADDFIAKDIAREHLVSMVRIKAERYRVLRSQMERDSLTGLLKHSRIKEQLKIEIARASRSCSTLAFAMLDIDDFKSVNDTYGHLAGDRVLRSLSRLLQQRLRRSDIIGRYGGEEFAVVLADSDADESHRIIDDVRHNFSKVRHKSSGEDFFVTFSGGISSYPACRDAEEMTVYADSALYRAKELGRNRVCR